MLEWPYSYLVGYGWNAHEYSGIWKSAHNVYLDIWYELGMIGMLMFFWLLYSLITRLLPAIRLANTDDRRVLIGYTFGMLAVYVAISFVLLPTAWPYVWAITGIVMGYQSSIQADAVDQESRDRRVPPAPVIATHRRPSR